LEDIISFSSVHWHLGEKGRTPPSLSLKFLILNLSGWRFATADEKLPGENTIPDPLHPDFTHLRDLYFSNEPDYTGRFTVPVLFDKKTNRIVSNEVRISSNLIPTRISHSHTTERRNHPHALLRI
jgi:glutathionyl-hydroquinone reductase